MLSEAVHRLEALILVGLTLEGLTRFVLVPVECSHCS
jgi:hypothetical protein